MDYHEKLRNFFSNKALSQKDIASKLGYSPMMMSKYFNSSPPNLEFLSRLIKNFPDIDLNHLFREEESTGVVNEPAEEYGNPHKLIDEIERNLQELRKKI